MLPAMPGACHCLGVLACQIANLEDLAGEQAGGERGRWRNLPLPCLGEALVPAMPAQANW